MGRWAAFFARIKNRVHTVHGFGFHDNQSKLGWTINFILEYLTSLITTHYVCVSVVDRKIGQRLFPRFWNKSSIIRAAVDTRSFGPAQRHECQQATNTTSTPVSFTPVSFTFGTVSCLKPQKNIIDLLKAFSAVYHNLPPDKKQHVRLQIIGDGVERKQIETWIKTHNLSNSIDLLGWQTDVAQWMKTWDAFVMSSLWEGLPCAIIEARLSKLPVISYRIAGIPEVIKNNKNGFLVTPGAWQQLGRCMQTLVENRALHTKLAHHQEDLSDFTHNAMITNHIKLYKKLTKGRSPSKDN